MEAETALRPSPAPFSAEILAAARRILPKGPGLALDPFAGTGSGLELLSELGWTPVGWEMEAEWASQDPRTRCGDFLENDLHAGSVDLVFTSPTYGNRMADTYAGSPADMDHLAATGKIRRRTYRIALGRALTAGNTGSMQWGDQYRATTKQLLIEIDRKMRPAGWFCLNISDHIRDNEVQPVTAFYINVICGFLGHKILRMETIQTRRYRDGANREARVPFEHLILFQKP